MGDRQRGEKTVKYGDRQKEGEGDGKKESENGTDRGR